MLALAIVLKPSAGSRLVISFPQCKTKDTMDSKIAEIRRSDVDTTEESNVSITGVKYLSSYNWIETRRPTIAVPGSPPLWSPFEGPQKVPKDSGVIYRNQNAARHPKSPLEPLFRALYTIQPSFSMDGVDLITDRNNLRKLLCFINPKLERSSREPFTINVEVTSNNTAIFCRDGVNPIQFVKRNEFRGFGHEFEKAYTTNQVTNGAGHHRIISYQLGSLSLILRYETDAYVDGYGNMMDSNLASNPSRSRPPRNPANGDLSSMLDSLSLGHGHVPSSSSSSPAVRTNLTVKEEGKAVPNEATLEIKTRIAHKPLSIQEVIPQLWIAQTPNLVRAYHNNGLFRRPGVEDLTAEIKAWEDGHQKDLARLVGVIRRIIEVVGRNGGKGVVKFDRAGDQLVVSKGQGRLLPDDLYSIFDEQVRLDH